jgi:hypothetical protein
MFVASELARQGVARGVSVGARTPADDVAWLIERGQSEGQAPTIWWTGEAGDYPWTEDANKARRFTTKADADAAILERSHFPNMWKRYPPFGRATEHVWMASAPRAPEAPTPSEAAIKAAIEMELCHAGGMNHSRGRQHGIVGEMLRAAYAIDFGVSRSSEGQP